MTFAEANAQYELIKQRFLAGELTGDQYDEQLRDLMVTDDAGRWWAKSRENGAWHYYDAALEAWVTAVPPLEDDSPPGVARDMPSSPTAETLAAGGAGPEPIEADESEVAEPTFAEPEPHPAASDGRWVTAPVETPFAEPSVRPHYGQGALPKWAAVAPPLADQPVAPGATVQQAKPAAPAGAAASGYNAHDFAPVPELGIGLKIVFYFLAFFVPLLGLVLFLAYRNKPTSSDRAAARIFLILGVISVILYGLCGGILVVAETALLAAGA